MLRQVSLLVNRQRAALSLLKASSPQQQQQLGRSAVVYLSSQRAPPAVIIQNQQTRRFATAAEKKESDAKAAASGNEEQADDSKELNFKMLDRDLTIGELTKLILNTPSEQFNHVNCATALYRLGRLRDVDRSASKTLWEETKSAEKLIRLALTKQEFGPREVNNMCFGIAVGRLDKLLSADVYNKFVDFLAKQQLTQLSTYSVSQLRTVGWSFARTETKNADDFTKALLAAASSHQPLEDFSGKDLSDLTWTMAQTKCKDTKFLQAVVSKRVPALLTEIESKDLAQLVWSLGKLEYKQDDALLKSICGEIRARGLKDGFALQRLSQIIWGLGSLHYKDDELLKSALEVTKEKMRYVNETSKKEFEFGFWTFGLAKEFEQQVEGQRRKAQKAAEKKLKLKQERQQSYKEKVANVQQQVQALQQAQSTAGKSHSQQVKKHHH